MPKKDNGNDVKNRILETALNHLEKVKINPKNKKLILSFINDLTAEGITKDRQSKYIYTTIKISQGVKDKDFHNLTRDDIKKFIANINNTNFSEWTKRDYRIITKRLIKYVKETEGKRYLRGRYPLEVEWINTSMKQSKKKLPKELLTIDDVKHLSEHTFNLRDKAFILFLYETGARIGEILNIKLKDIDYDEHGARITLMGKTGARKVRIIASAPSISNWVKHHPLQNDKESWLFCSINHANQGEQGHYFYYNKLLREAKKRAGLDKPVNPHHFRHSRATQLAKKLTEAQLCAYMGWVPGSKEAATYVHLSGRDTDNAILTLHGLKEEETERDTFTPIECPRCGIKNEPGARFCSGCSLGLDEQSMMEYDQQKEQALKTGFTTQEMLKDREFREFYNDMLAKTWEQYKKIKSI
jgi:integrase